MHNIVNLCKVFLVFLSFFDAVGREFYFSGEELFNDSRCAFVVYAVTGIYKRTFAVDIMKYEGKRKNFFLIKRGVVQPRFVTLTREQCR